MLTWCSSWSNSLWQGWSCGLVHCTGGNTADPIWRVLASSDGISSWTPLKPQHSNPNPNSNSNQQPQNVETELLPMGHQFMPHISDAQSTSHGKSAPLHDHMYLESTFLPYRGHDQPYGHDFRSMCHAST